MIEELKDKVKNLSFGKVDFVDANIELVNLTETLHSSQELLDTLANEQFELKDNIKMLVSTERNDNTGVLIYNTDKLRETETNNQLKNNIRYNEIHQKILDLETDIEIIELKIEILNILIDTMKVLL